MPFNPNQVGRLQTLVEAILAGLPAGPAINVNPTELSEKELAMKTQTRDMLLVNLDQLINRASRMRDWLKETPARSLSETSLEGHVTPLVAEVDSIFLATAPSMEKQAVAVRGGADHDEDSE